MLGLRTTPGSARVPLTSESQLFGVLILTKTGEMVTVGNEGESGTTVACGQYLLFLQEISIRSSVDCLVLYFRKRVVNPVAQT